MSVSLPTRMAGKLKPTAAPGLLLGSVAVAVIFAATTFAIPATITEFDVGPGLAALISTVQVGGFTISNLVGGRRLTPTATMARGALLVMVVANVVSAVTPSFLVLLALRLISGLAMGLFTWIAWADSAADAERRSEIAAIGPLTAAVAAPLLALAADGGGLTTIYLVLAAVSLLCLALPITVEATISSGRRPIAAKGIKPVLLGMGALTLGGSAVAVFAGVIAFENVGMSSLGLSVALSLNALAGIPAARYRHRRRFPGIFIMITGACAFFMATANDAYVFTAAFAVWGLAFWTAVPETYDLLQERSQHPADRIGDAQAVMAFGRVLGPTVGGILIAGGSYVLLGIVAGGIMVAGGLLIEFVATSHRWGGAAAVGAKASPDPSTSTDT